MILALETATTVCSVALIDDGNVVYAHHLHEPRAHAQKLAQMIETALHETRLTFPQLDAIAVSKGPGSYTGLRIGVSTAKGLAFAHDLPLIGINALEGLAQSVLKDVPENAVICVLFDARRNESFMAAFRKKEGELYLYMETCSVFVETLEETLALEPNEMLYLVGDGAAKSVAGFSEVQPILLPLETHFPNASGIAECAAKRLKKHDFEEVASFEPFYLKDFEAKPSKKIPFVVT